MKPYVNQLGYLPQSKKTAIVAVATSETETPSLDITNIQVCTPAGDCILEKPLIPKGFDVTAGDYVWQADFSELTECGTYIIQAGNVSSYPFRIDTELYSELNVLLCKMLYFQRCGMELEEKYAGKFARPTCHMNPVVLWDEYLKNKTGELDADSMQKFNIRGGWHDAGDFGRYTTAAACALAHILYAYRFFPDSFTQDLNIPESGNGIPDILNECRYELDWLLQMQTADGGVYHKLTTERHAAFVMPHEDLDPMILLPVSSMAVGDFAAVMALASRVYRPFDATFADKALAAALKSYGWLEQHPEFLGFRNSTCGSGTGEYGDSTDLDERMWAAMELYRCTGEDKYLAKTSELFEQHKKPTELGWADISGFAGWALLENRLMTAPKQSRIRLSDAEQALTDRYIKVILQEADRLVSVSETYGYGAAMEINDYVWGSNMVLLNYGMLLSTAYLLTQDSKYFDVAVRQMDYLLGVNAVDYSYVTGVGAHAYEHPHNRITEADGIDETIPGYVSGGPNRRPGDPVAHENIVPGTPPMKCFLDHWSCYSLNEITIYWNSPAIFVAAFLNHIRKTQ